MENLVFKIFWIEQARKFRFTWLSLTLQVHLFINFASWFFLQGNGKCPWFPLETQRYTSLQNDWQTRTQFVTVSIQCRPGLSWCHACLSHTPLVQMSKSWGAGIISPTFILLEGIPVVLTGHQKEAGSSFETLVPSSGICLRQSQSITLETPVKLSQI